MADSPKKETLVVTNFHGSMTPYINGSINSGLAYVLNVSGYDPFTKPGSLTWNEQATQIDPNGNVITDLILDIKTRVESGVLYAYAIGHTGRLYKIQVNDPATYNPDYDNPVLLATLSINSPTFKYGGFIDFWGSSQKILISHDKGVTSINFNGSGEAFVGVLGSWTQNVPKPLCQFLGKEYIGNGSNFAELDATNTITSYTKLSPGFPTGTQIRDIDLTPDGTYLQCIVTDLAAPDLTLTTPPTDQLSPGDSYVFKWNGTDTNYTSMITYPSVTLTSGVLFGENNFISGYDALGGGFYNPVDKFLTSTPNSAFGVSPGPNAITSFGNTFLAASVLPYEGVSTMIITLFGTVSKFEIEPGYWCLYDQFASGDETDILQVPYMGVVSNFAQGSSFNGYTSAVFGKPKIYFSTLEVSDAPTTKYKLFKWAPVPVNMSNAHNGAIYQTQNQLFSKKVTVSEVRIYGEPWVNGTSFIVDLIGSNGLPIPNASKTFSTADGSLTVGNDYAWYGPDPAPTYAIGLSITNNSNINNTIYKAEIDYSSGGR